MTAHDDCVYVTDRKRVQVFDSAGKFVRKLNGFELGSPHGLAFDRKGNAFVVDREQCCIHVLDSAGTYVRSFGARGGGHAQFSSPACIALHRDSLFVCELANCRVQQLTCDGVAQKKFGDGQRRVVQQKNGWLENSGLRTLWRLPMRARSTSSKA